MPVPVVVSGLRGEPGFDLRALAGETGAEDQGGVDDAVQNRDRIAPLLDPPKPLGFAELFLVKSEYYV